MHVSREADLLALLRECRTMIADLDAGWPTKELHRSPESLIEEVTTEIGDGDEWSQGGDDDA